MKKETKAKVNKAGKILGWSSFYIIVINMFVAIVLSWLVTVGDYFWITSDLVKVMYFIHITAMTTGVIGFTLEEMK